MIKIFAITVLGVGLLGAAPERHIDKELPPSFEVTLGVMTLKTAERGLQAMAAKKPGFSCKLTLSSGRVFKLSF